MCVCVCVYLRRHPAVPSTYGHSKSTYEVVLSVGSPRWLHGETNESLCESSVNLTCPRAVSKAILREERSEEVEHGRVATSGRSVFAKRRLVSCSNIIGNCCSDRLSSVVCSSSSFSPKDSMRNFLDKFHTESRRMSIASLKCYTNSEITFYSVLKGDWQHSGYLVVLKTYYRNTASCHTRKYIYRGRFGIMRSIREIFFIVYLLSSIQKQSTKSSNQNSRYSMLD